MVIADIVTNVALNRASGEQTFDSRHLQERFGCTRADRNAVGGAPTLRRTQSDAKRHGIRVLESAKRSRVGHVGSTRRASPLTVVGVGETARRRAAHRRPGSAMAAGLTRNRSQRTVTSEDQTRRNKENVIAFYDLMFNQCQPSEAI